LLQLDSTSFARGDVNENIVSALVRLDEPEPPVRIKHFQNACRHLFFPKNRKRRPVVMKATGFTAGTSAAAARLSVSAILTQRKPKLNSPH
jgi:hypothetical protein